MDLNKRLNFEECRELIFNIIQNQLKFSKEDLQSEKRNRPLADARMMVSRILKTKFPYVKLEIIGAATKRDHSTVVHHLKKHNNFIDTNDDYVEQFNMISEEFYTLSDKNIYSMDDLLTIKKTLEDKLDNVNSILHDIESVKKLKKSHS